MAPSSDTGVTVMGDHGTIKSSWSVGVLQIGGDLRWPIAGGFGA